MIRIVRNEEANCINFEGSSVPAYFNACLSATAVGDYINIKNDIRSALAGEEFFEFSDIHYSEFEDRDGNTFASAIDTADYITLNGNVAAPNDVNVGYKGVYNASNNTPDLVSGSIPHNNGDWYFVEEAGTQTLSGVSYNLKINDIVKWDNTNTRWDVIPDKSASISDIEGSALAEYDLYVDADYTGTVRTGTSVHPFVDLAQAITDAFDGASILIKGNIIVTNSSTDAFTLPADKSLSFFGAKGSCVGYASYNSNNGNVFNYESTLPTKSLSFQGLKIVNAGKYGILTDRTIKVDIDDCVFEHNGWDGTQLNTILPSSTSGLLGYDSTDTDLQSFYASIHASDGGAIRVQGSIFTNIVANTVSENLRGIRLQDCGVGGAGFVTRNISTQNIESGIYLAAGTQHYGCQNIVVTINSSSYNANNGLLCVGGINNKFSQNEVNGNWNAGACGWGSGNLSLRNLGIYDNNRSAFNGVGNIGDAKASVQINDSYDLSGETISVTPDARFIVEVLDNQVHYTGLGSSSERIGVFIASSVGALPDNNKNIINIDNNGFIGQDYAIDFSECDITNLRISLGDNRYQSIDNEAVRGSIAGNYYELPFSNHITEVGVVDIVVDNVRNTVALHEGVGGSVINLYSTDEIKAVEYTTYIDLVQNSTQKIQLRNLQSGSIYLNGSLVTGTLTEINNSINTALVGSGTSTGNLPVITSNLNVNIAQGDTLNYELTADYGVGYEWDLSGVDGIVIVEGNPRKIIGGSSLLNGNYTIPVKAINYNGADAEILNLTVDSPAFANTKSVQFNTNDWLFANAGILNNVLGRSSNGSGNSDAWTIAFWFKPGTSTNSSQTIFYFGSQDIANQGHIQVKYNGQNNIKRLEVKYGTNNNNIIFLTQLNSLTVGEWNHVVITYNGGTTGSSSGSINTYYSRFGIYLNGVDITNATIRLNSNYGYSGSIIGQNLRVGRYNNSQSMRNNCKVDELAIWDSDESNDIASIYNNGTPRDLMLLGSQPKHWWRMGDGDSFPYLFDTGSEANCIFLMQNMTAADIVSDAPVATVNVNPNQYTVSVSNNGQLINMLYNGGWTIILPPLSAVPTGFNITIRSLAHVSNTGLISTYSSETVDGYDDLSANGRIELTLTKQSSSGWVTSNIINHDSYTPPHTVIGDVMTINDTYHNGAVNRVMDFSNISTIVINHNIGGIPQVQVWLPDGSGGYTDASVDIDHDWDTMLTSTVNIGEISTGKLIYTFNN